MASFLHIRGALPQTREKLRTGQPLTVAWLGGSITWGYAASDPDTTSLRALVSRWMKDRYPRSSVESINAGIGGTGSDLGAMRLKQDVLRHEPDLLLVEFAVNDNNKPIEQVQRWVEGIIRHARTDASKPEILLLYTGHRGWVAGYKSRHLPPSVAAHELVAEHNRVPSVNLGAAIAADVNRGAITWDALMVDDVHPRDSGFAHYASTLQNSLEELLEKPVQPAGGIHLPPPLTAHPVERGDVVPVSPSQAVPGWKYVPMEFKGGWDYFHGVLESNTPGAELSLDFEGTAVGVLTRVGPSSGNIEFRIDQGDWEPRRLFDDFAQSFWRPVPVLLRDKLAPGHHRLEVRVASEQDPRSAGRLVQIGYLMVDSTAP